MGVSVFVADEQHAQPVDMLQWHRLTERVLDAEGIRGNVEVSVLFVDEQTIADLNRRFNSKDGPTDVLAFPIDEDPAEGGRSPDSGGSGPGYTPAEPADLPTLLGDVVICPQVAARNAPEHAGTYDDELALLVVHGLLHLLGMDHDEDDDAVAMETREQDLLARFHRGVASAPVETSHGSEAPVDVADPMSPGSVGSVGPG
jgi:probable rRNA maturation factor